MTRPIIIEVSGGVVQEVWNAPDGYIVVDYDSGDAPELPPGYRYGVYGVEEDEDTEGQDRKSYTDTQDRQSYTVSNDA